MLYVSTRNANDSYTAHRALHNAVAPDGGFYLPYRMNAFSPEALLAIKAQLPGETIAQILNLFFAAELTGWDVECAIGRVPFKQEALNQKLTVAELWRNPNASCKYLIDSLYRLLTENPFARLNVCAWPQIAIRIAILFGLYSASEISDEQGFDIALSAGDFADVTAVLFAKDMGLPVNTVVCAFSGGSAAWDVITRGVISGTAEQPAYMECFLYKKLGLTRVQGFLTASKTGKSLWLDEEEVLKLREGLFAAVVSNDRIEPIVSSFQQTNNYALDASAAQAYGGLQDYRAKCGAIRDARILVKERPAAAKG